MGGLLSFCFLPPGPQPDGTPGPLPVAPFQLTWNRSVGVAVAAVLAVLLHAALLVWFINRPAPLSFTQAAPLPMIDITLAAPPAPPVSQPDVPPPPIPPKEMKKPELKPEKKPKPKPKSEVKQKVVKPAEPKEEVQEAAPPAPPAPPLPRQDKPAAPRNEPYTPASSDANYLHNPRPVYPGIARQRHWEGLVLLKVYVTPEGHCGQLAVARSSGHEVLDESAMDAVREWRFVSAKRGSTPVASWVTVPIEFNLE